VVRNLKGSFQVDRSTLIYADAGAQPGAGGFEAVTEIEERDDGIHG
jgi:hypothetical protein